MIRFERVASPKQSRWGRENVYSLEEQNRITKTREKSYSQSFTPQRVSERLASCKVAFFPLCLSLVLQHRTYQISWLSIAFSATLKADFFPYPQTRRVKFHFHFGRAGTSLARADKRAREAFVNDVIDPGV